MSTSITVETFIAAPIEKIWHVWTDPEEIRQWNFASPDWCTRKAENDVRVGGRFKTRMEAKDGSAGFDFEGTYTVVEPHEKIEYVLDDERRVRVEFVTQGEGYRVAETFDAEGENAPEMQRAGWQAILDNFKKRVLGELS